MASREEYENMIERLTKALKSAKTELKDTRQQLWETEQRLAEKQQRIARLQGERDEAREATKIVWKKLLQIQNKSTTKNTKARPEKFSGSGNDTDFEAFLDQFEACARMSSWDEEEKRNQLILSVKDRARVVLSQLSEEQKSDYQSMVKALRDKIGMRQVPEAAKATLKARRRKVGESLLDLSIEIKRLCKEAYPTLGAESMERACIDHFADALGVSLAKDVIRAKPETLDKALAEALELEALELKAIRVRERVVGEVSSIDEGSKKNSVPSWAPELSNLIASATAKATAEAIANLPPPGKGIMRRDPPRQGCWSCGSTSHFRRDCPGQGNASRARGKF